MTDRTNRRFALQALLATAGVAIAPLLGGCAGAGAAPGPDLVRTLAPAGRLRVGVYPGSPTSMVRDPASGEVRGVSLDIGRELAARLGVPFERVEFQRVAEVIDALVAGQVDFTITNASAARVRLVDFSAPLIDLELGYLVPAGSPLTVIADIDRPGVRVGVSQGSSSQAALSRDFNQARVVPAPSLAIAIDMLARGALDAFATNKGVLFELNDQLRGSRVLDGRWGLEHLAIAIPKGRDQGLDWVKRFADEMKAGGEVRRAAARAGLRGLMP